MTAFCLVLLAAAAPGAHEAAIPDTARYVVTKIIGTSPLRDPIPDLPMRFIREGDELLPGDVVLSLKQTTIVITDRATGDVYTIPGPNRVTVTGDSLKINAEFSVERGQSGSPLEIRAPFPDADDDLRVALPARAIERWWTRAGGARHVDNAGLHPLADAR